MWAELLYGLHGVLETLAFLLIIGNGGHYPTETTEERALSHGAEFDRRIRDRKIIHAVALLTLGVIGLGMVQQGLCWEPFAAVTSAGFTTFHGGTMLMDLLAGERKYAVHYPFALGFLAHLVVLTM